MLRCPQCGRHYSPGLQVCPEDGTLLQADATIATPNLAISAQHKTATDALTGTVLDGKYRLDRPLGVGGMGTVFRATHLLIDRPVAVKVLNPRLVTDEAAQERLRREARAAGRLRHTNAVAVTDFGQTSDGIMYVVMELLEGVTLRELLAGRSAPLDAPEAISIMMQVSAAVAAAHEAGIIHRDLKPGNIFILERPNNTPVVKVLDFGIAKVAAHEEEDGTGSNSTNEIAAALTLTETGVMIGTPRYMSPEQCDGVRLTPAADVYSLGIIFYEMLTGATPFNGPTPLSVALKHSAEPPRPLHEIIETIPPELERIILNALAKRPEERPRDAGEFRRELSAVAEELGLIHASGFSAPTAEMLREAGTETPSGRLVIDIERLRESRSTISSASGAAITAENPTPFDTVAVGRASPIEPPSRLPTVVTPPEESSAASETSRRQGESGYLDRVEDARKWLARTWLQRPAVLVGGGVVALLLLVVLASTLVRLASSGDAKGVAQPTVTAADSSEPQAQVAQSDRRSGAKVMREPQTANDFYERGGDLFAQRDYDAAERDLKRALELQPDFPEAHNRLGRAYVQQGKFTAAVAEFRRAIEGRNGDFAIANFNLGDALERAGDYREAIKAYEAAIANRSGGYPEAHFEIGRIYFNRGRNREAAASFRQAADTRRGRDPETYYYLGVALARGREFGEAETALRAAVEQRDGNYPEAHYALGLLYENTNRPADAVRAYETYLQQQPDAVNRRAIENTLRNMRRRLGADATQPDATQSSGTTEPNAASR